MNDYTTTSTEPRKPDDVVLVIHCLANDPPIEVYRAVKELAIEEIKYQPFYGAAQENG